jgi:hypothetical protein
MGENEVILCESITTERNGQASDVVHATFGTKVAEA